MKKQKLYIFAGKPGSGKTTILKKLFPRARYVDILHFYNKVHVRGKILEKHTRKAYESLYASIDRMEDKVVVVEIGAKHPALSVRQIDRLQKRYDVRLFLCDASRTVCYERALERGMRHTPRQWAMRMRVNFPAVFLKRIARTAIPHHVVDMEQSLARTIKKFKGLLL